MGVRRVCVVFVSCLGVIISGVTFPLLTNGELAASIFFVSPASSKERHHREDNFERSFERVEPQQDSVQNGSEFQADPGQGANQQDAHFEQRNLEGSSSNGESDYTRSQSDNSGQRVGNAGGTAGRGDYDDLSKPPRTVENLVKRLFASKPNSQEEGPQERKPNSPRRGAEEEKKVDANRKGVERKRVTTGHGPAEVMPEFAAHEILAINASPAVVAHAKSLGFQAVHATSLSRLSMSVTRLLPPPGMDANSAQALLSQGLPGDRFGLNQTYRIYKTAMGTKPGQLDASSAARDAGKTACDADHCYGRSLIGWKSPATTCAANVRIGIIDTAVDLSHPAFSHRKMELRHLSTNGMSGPDWHGTGVAALLAGDPSSGTPGLVPNAQFVVADIFHADADGEPASDTFGMLRALDWLDAKRVNIVNMSLSGPRDDLVEDAIRKLSAKGVLFVAAAGNEGPAAPPSYPAAYDSVIAVTAVSQNLHNYRYANRGSYIDIAAPGVAIWTALPGSKEGYHSGTSFATPFVTASLAAIYSQHPLRSKKDALGEMAFQDLGPPGRDTIYGEGLILAPSTCGSSNQMARSAQNVLPMPSNSKLGGFPEVERLPWLPR